MALVTKTAQSALTVRQESEPMNEHKPDQELLLLAEQLEGRLSERTPEISHLAQQVSQMKEVFKSLPEEKLSQSAKQRLFAVLHRAFELRFNPETAQQKEVDFQQLYQMLKGFTQENLESIIAFGRIGPHKSNSRPTSVSSYPPYNLARGWPMNAAKKNS